MGLSLDWTGIGLTIWQELAGESVPLDSHWTPIGSMGECKDLINWDLCNGKIMYIHAYICIRVQ